ncbi:MAG: GTP-binding protein [Promethearchaeota archaeon]
MIFDKKEKELKVKIVFFGPAMSGKTTSLKSLMKGYNNNNLTSIETSTGRTLVFDFGTLTIKGNDLDIKIMLLTATGQDFYASTRPSTIEMLDGIIFVVDSQYKLLEDNIRSWKELFLYFGERLYSIPIIICLNKQDLPNVIDSDLVVKHFDLQNYKKTKIIKTIASKGVGIKESFKSLMQFIFPEITIMT